VPPPHRIKIFWLDHFRKKYDLNILIETGTYKGATVAAFLNNFSRIYTIELDPILYRDACTRFADHPHVNVIQGDSSYKLPDILSKIKTPSLFWLDGHYSGGSTARGEVDTPIIAELIAIQSHECNHHVILIDDARLFNGANDYPILDATFTFLKNINSNYNIRVVDNIIQAFPQKRK